MFLADATAPAPGQPQASPLSLFVPMALMLVILYFMMFRPQQQQRAKHAEMLKKLKSGDKIVTAGGVVGVVVTVKEQTISLRSADAKMEVTRSSVAEILESSNTTES